jgi:Flp pilus assembly protein TadD
MRATPPPSIHRFLAFAAIGLSALALGGCFNRNGSDITGSIARGQPMTQVEARSALQQMGAEYDRRPGEKRASLAYARLLRETNQHAQAIAVLQTAAIKAPNDSELLAAYGKALADGGRFREAQDVLARAHTPDRPNWRILSAQGAIQDQLGQHQTAREFYQSALRIQPGDPIILSNLGLSYLLSNRLGDAERSLREAAAHPQADGRIRANLALALNLQGKHQEADALTRGEVSPEDQAANRAFVRGMVAQNNSWRQLQAQSGTPPRR